MTSLRIAAIPSLDSGFMPEGGVSDRPACTGSSPDTAFVTHKGAAACLSPLPWPPNSSKPGGPLVRRSEDGVDPEGVEQCGGQASHQHTVASPASRHQTLEIFLDRPLQQEILHPPPPGAPHTPA